MPSHPKVLEMLVALALFSASPACKTPEPPTVTPRLVQVTGVDPGGLNLRVDLEVYNPNSVPLIARSVDGTLTVDSNLALGRGHADLNGSIPAGQTQLVSSTLRVGFENLPALSPLLLNGQPVPYRFSGVAKIGGERLNVDVPFQLQGQLSAAELLDAGMRGLAAPR